MSELSNAIKKLAASGLMACMNGEIISVDRNDMTCEVSFGDEDSVVASLVCGDKKKGIVQVPKVGSNVVVMFYSPTIAFVVMVDEVEEILINGGENGGLVKIDELTKKINELIDAFNQHTHSVATTGSAAAQSGTAAVIANSFTKLDKSSYEDKTIKH